MRIEFNQDTNPNVKNNTAIIPMEIFVSRLLNDAADTTTTFVFMYNS